MWLEILQVVLLPVVLFLVIFHWTKLDKRIGFALMLVCGMVQFQFTYSHYQNIFGFVMGLVFLVSQVAQYPANTIPPKKRFLAYAAIFVPTIVQLYGLYLLRETFFFFLYVFPMIISQNVLVRMRSGLEDWDVPIGKYWSDRKSRELPEG